MKFVLNKDKLKIENTEVLNSGSVNYYEAEIEFDETWNSLSKEAIIIKENETQGKSIAVIDNKIYIDKELKGIYCIGFIGYTIENDVKTYQISSNLKRIFFNKGAGEIEVSNSSEVLTPTEWEIYIAQIQSMLDEDTLVRDENYVHTDNNFTNGYKENIDNNTVARHTHNNKVILDGITVNDISNWNNKQNAINDLENIRSGASKGATAIQEEIDPTVPNYVKNITQTNITNWNNKADKNEIPDVSNFITKDVNNLTNYYKTSETYTKTEIDNKLSSVYKYKGTKETYSQLPSTDLTIGDVWNIETADSQHGIKAGDNVAWNGTIWDVLSGTMDLSGYQTLIDNSHKLSSDLVDDTN